MSEQGNGRWQIDRRIPIAVIGVVVAQSIAIGVWVGGISTRVEAAEKWIEATKLEDHHARISVLGSRLDDIRSSLTRIEQRLGIAQADAPPRSTAGGR